MRLGNLPIIAKLFTVVRSITNVRHAIAEYEINSAETSYVREVLSGQKNKSPGDSEEAGSKGQVVYLIHLHSLAPRRLFSMFSGVHFVMLQLLYPLLMFVTVWRTIRVRVYPNVLLIFREFTSEETGGGERGVLSRVRNSWRNDYSLFSWADKGQWETVETRDGKVQRDGDWFRIGFEPVFVDYTKRGTWFFLAQLIEVCVGGEDGT